MQSIVDSAIDWHSFHGIRYAEVLTPGQTERDSVSACGLIETRRPAAQARRHQQCHAMQRS